MSADLITARGLVYRRGAFTLQIADWRVAPGRVVGLVGPNGAGKTTLLRMLPGLEVPDAGALRVMGMDPWRAEAPVRQQIGFMSDDMPVFNMRIDRLLRAVSGYYPTWNEALVQRLVTRFEIPLRARPYQLSKGQGTRLRLLLAMAFEPRILVLDEPATGLDLAGRRALLGEVLDVVRDPNRAALISSHNLGDLERIADEVLVLDEGAVVRQGPIDQLVQEGQTLEEALLTWGAT